MFIGEKIKALARDAAFNLTSSVLEGALGYFVELGFVKRMSEI